MAHRFIVASQQRYAQLLSRRSARRIPTTQAPLIHRRSGLELTGAFLFIALLVAAGASLHADSATHIASNDSTSPANGGANVQLSQTSANTNSTDNTNASVDPSTTTQTTQVTNTSNGDNSSTTVMVNGKPVSVPKNGTYHKTTTTDGGQSSVTVTNGTASNSSFVQTNVDVSSSSTNDQEGN